MNSTELPPAPPRYQLLRHLGSGGMGRVWEARDRELDRVVALKFLDIEEIPSARERFVREARTLAAIRSPRVVEIYDFDATSSPPWIAMEHLTGTDLLDCGPELALPAYLEAARGLAEVHRAGVVHRDVKPANILRTAEGRVVLIDFGLARGDHDPGLTSSRVLVGTPAYLAPELFRGARASPASDIYAWAVSLFASLERRLPFPGSAAGAPSPAPDPASIDFAHIDPEGPLARLVQRCLSPDPARRPAGCREVARELELALAGRECMRSGRTEVLRAPPPRRGNPTRASHLAGSPLPSRRRPRRATGPLALAGSLALAAAVALAWPRPSPGPPPPTPGPTRDPGFPVGDMVGELRTRIASEAPAHAFLPLYRERGVGAYADLPAFRAWDTWLGAGGDPGDLPPSALASLRAADQAARGLGLAPPFGPAWDLPREGGSVGQRVEAVARAGKALLDGDEELRFLALTSPESFPDVTRRPNVILSERLQLHELLLQAHGPDTTPSPAFEVFMESFRARWIRFAALAARAHELSPPPPGLPPPTEIETLLDAKRDLAWGATSGARIEHLLAHLPRRPAARYVMQAAADALAGVARAIQMQPHRDAFERARDWEALSEDPAAPDRLRSGAWLAALRNLRLGHDRARFRALLERREAEFESALEETAQAWLRDARRWARPAGAGAP